MPELPEVQTIVDDLNKKVKGLTITDIWTDWPKYFSARGGPALGWKRFRETVKNKKILNVWRLGKNIIFDLSGGKKMLIHQKMTGHMLVGKWQLKNNKWVPAERGPLQDKINGYIHVMFFLSGGKTMGLSDVRKFAKVLAVNEKDFNNLEDVKNIGPDPLVSGFTVGKFISLVNKKRGPIKKVLMDQNVVSGIGNIYADDILFTARIHPLKKTEKLSDEDLRKIFGATLKVLKKAVKLRGTSVSDYRDTAGKKGGYGDVRLVYKREGEKCSNKCGGIIKRIKINSRSAHFCPICQKP